MGFLPFSTAISRIIKGMKVFQDFVGSKVDNKTLCERFGVEVFRVGDTCFGEDQAVWIEAQDLDKFFVSTLAGTFDAAVVKAIPLATSVDEAQTLAVRHLGLRELQFPIARPTFSGEVFKHP